MMKLFTSLVTTLFLVAPSWADDPLPMMQETQQGGLTLKDGFVYATLPNQPVAGGFLTITNAGDQDDRLIAVSADMTDVAQIHTMIMQDGVMVMRELPDGLALPSGETVVLEPGGYHLMFMQLDDALVAGETAQVSLTFEMAGDVGLVLPIRARMTTKTEHGSEGDS